MHLTCRSTICIAGLLPHPVTLSNFHRLRRENSILDVLAVARTQNENISAAALYADPPISSMDLLHSRPVTPHSASRRAACKQLYYSSGKEVHIGEYLSHSGPDDMAEPLV